MANTSCGIGLVSAPLWESAKAEIICMLFIVRFQTPLTLSAIAANYFKFLDGLCCFTCAEIYNSRNFPAAAGVPERSYPCINAYHRPSVSAVPFASADSNSSLIRRYVFGMSNMAIAIIPNKKSPKSSSYSPSLFGFLFTTLDT